MTTETQRGPRGGDGFALIAVLIALGILLALAVPFLLRMGHGEAAARALGDEKKVELLAASAREWLLHEVARGHASVEETPMLDGRGEFPAALAMPEAFADVQRDGPARHLLAGETYDLQSRINLNSASPLLLANLLGLASSLRVEHAPEATELAVEGIDAFPEAGFVIVDRELIRYGRKTADTLADLERGVMAEAGFASAEEHTLPAGALVLDFRCVAAVVRSFYFAGEERAQLRPWAAVDELAGMDALPFGGFTIEELDVLRANCTVGSIRETAADWGRPERVFDAVPAGTFTLRVRSATFLGAGSIVRIRTLDGKKVEHGLVWSTEVPAAYVGTVNLPSRGFLNLLLPVTQDFPEVDTVIEPLLPHPVNVNTAAEPVLAALIENLRAQPRSQRHDAARVIGAPRLSRTEARTLAQELRALRGDDDVPDEARIADARPFEGFEDLVRRFIWPKLADAEPQRKDALMRLYRVLETGLPGDAEMGTAPVCFASAPLVHYRAAALRHRFGREAARHEVEGEAVVMPGRALDLVLASQVAFEEAFRLDRRAPYFQTLPINLGALAPLDRGADPAPRFLAHVLAKAWPDIGFGEPRFASRDGNDAGFKPAPSTTPFRYPRALPQAFESAWSAQHPEGLDLPEEGPLRIENSQSPAGSDRDHRPRFAFTDPPGTPQRHAVSFWFQPRQVGEQMLFDLSGDLPLRNRISLQIRDQHLRLEVFDEAGQDEDEAGRAAARTSPERTAGTWQVPIADLPLEADTWYHANLSAEGNRPGQLSLLIDGVPRAEPELRTYLARPISAYDRRNVDLVEGDFRSDRQRFLEIGVEDASSFPERGVLRIGLELFEYSARTATSFLCDYRDSIGGRFARMDLFEFRPGIPVDKDGRPSTNPNNLPGSSNDDIAPEHPLGAAVELYGYAVPLYRDSVVQVGSGQLVDTLGAFAIARAGNQNQSGLVGLIAGRQFLGIGIDDKFNNDLELGDPRGFAKNETLANFPQASDPILAGFPASGGYALLVQRSYTFTDPDPQRGGSITVGGIELIRYGRRQGSKLTNIQRGLRNPHTTNTSSNSFITGIANHYVLHWAPLFDLRGSADANEYPQLATFVVPISIPVRGNLIDPTVLGRSEWLQLHSPGNENDTEWLRYDWIYENTHVARGMPRAWTSTLVGLTRQFQREEYLVPAAIPPNNLDTTEPYGQPRQLSRDYIGYTDDVEVKHPAVAVARGTLEFRGDPFTRTSSHRQPANAVVLQAHRLELDWGNYGALSGRPGREDRVALVAGSQSSDGERPAVEWHTVNWSVRRPWFDVDPSAGGGGSGGGIGGGIGGGRQEGVERLGAWPFQLFALSAPVRQLFIGPNARDPNVDPRRLDRLVKFPSGERPAAALDAAWFGATRHEDAPPSTGLVDEVSLVGHLAEALALDDPLGDDGREFVVRTDLRVDALGATVQRGDLTALHPERGGLVAIDGEIIAYRSRSNGRFEIAANGRGLLGTEPRAHDQGAFVHFLDHVPAAILSAGLGESAREIVVEDMGALPPHGGTLLIGRTELAHYCWSHGTQLMVMPSWIEPGRADAERGLFRGRYGTAPASAQPGEPVIFFPFRYWDRWHERSDDPELGHFQVTWNQAPVFFAGLFWQEDRADPLVDLQCLVRIDGQGSFADDPQRSRHLLHFVDGSAGERPNPINRQASRLEARFFPVYRPGAFDPVQFRANSWKRAPTVRAVLATFEGESRILSERVTAR